MKHLSVFRHAKAENINGFPTDFARPLTSRGQKDAHHMGKLLANVEPTIDWISASPSQRTRETTEAVLKAFNHKPAVIWQDAIYEAEAETLLAVLAEIPEEMEHVLIIGHNPGMAELISGLVAGSPTRMGIHLSTAGLAHLTLEIYSWNQIRWGCGTLHSLLRPKLLREK